MGEIKFVVFSDFHYKKGMYAARLGDLTKIINRAKKEMCNLVIHGGDFCNDYRESPEIINLYLKSEIPVYGVYGNHELERKDNSMQWVTPLLTNDSKVVWGTADGQIGDGTIAYYYLDIDNFRFIFTDTNYSLNPETSLWEHNKTCSYGEPPGNIYANSLGPKQLKWLENLLVLSAEQGKKCIVVGHESVIIKLNRKHPEGQVLENLFKRVNSIRKGTVIMAINGHHHTNGITLRDNMVYFDVHTTRNCFWQGEKRPHYTEGQGQEIEILDEMGNVTGTGWQDYTNLSMHPNTWFSKEPLSAVVTITDMGEIKIQGSSSCWAYDIAPEKAQEKNQPKISSRTIRLEF